MPQLSDLEKETQEIKERNAKVEINKAWETSWTRKAAIFTLTYAAITTYFYVASLPDPFVNSLVPALAFVISTFSLPAFKKLWAKHINKPKQ